MQNILRDDGSSVPRLRLRPGFTALAVIVLSLGVGATTALFSIVDGLMPRSAPGVSCETVMKLSSGPPVPMMVTIPSREEVRDRVSDAYETSVETAGDAIESLPDVADGLGQRPLLALLGAGAIVILVASTRAASRMMTSPHAPLVAIGTTVGALAVATFSLRALELPAIGLRATAFALCVSMLAVFFARVSQKKDTALTV
jgi:hypothetical protein